MTLHLPLTMPLEELNSSIPFDEVLDKIHYVLAKSVAGNKLTFLFKTQYISCEFFHNFKLFFLPQLNVATSTIN